MSLLEQARHIIELHKPEALICTPETLHAIIKETGALTASPDVSGFNVSGFTVDGVDVEAVQVDNAQLGTFIAAWDLKYDGLGVKSFAAKWHPSVLADTTNPLTPTESAVG